VLTPVATAAAASTTPDPAASLASAAKKRSASSRRRAQRVRHLRHEVVHARRRALHAAHELGIHPRFRRSERHTSAPGYLRWMVRHWRRLGHRWRRQLRRQLEAPPGVISGLRCIHRYEGAMTSVNPAGPYYGGWQIDAGFEHAYGRRMLRKYHGHHANAWRPRDQLVVALNGYRHRGWSPWPATAAACGLG
jgi:hypothetical protein